jgi:hypothetical protein
MKKMLFLTFVTLSMLSCRIQGLTNDYNKLNPEQKKLIVALENFSDTKPNLIYKISGKQLQQELSKHPKSLVYIFKNGCTSKLCKPLMIYENYAKEHGLKLFLVMNGYANLNETLEQPYSSTLYSIDNDYYNSNMRNTYIRYFENEISNKPLKEKSKEYLGNLFFFERDQLLKIEHDLP